MLIQKISNKIGCKIGAYLNLDNDSRELIVYGAFNLMQAFLSIFWVIIFGIIFNVPLESIIVLCSIGLLRKYSGGVHATSPRRCLVIGTTISVGIALFMKKIITLGMVYNIICLFIVSIVISYYVIYIYAPVDSPSKPIVKIETRRKLKNMCFVILNIYTLLVFILIFIFYKYKNIILLNIIGAISLGVLWQSFTLTKLGHKVLSTIDVFFKNISLKEE